MIDFDSEDENILSDFLLDLNLILIKTPFTKTLDKTPHGYAIVVDWGFDARLADGTQLFDKWKDVATLKRDDLLCVDWGTK